MLSYHAQVVSSSKVPSEAPLNPRQLSQQRKPPPLDTGSPNWGTSEPVLLQNPPLVGHLGGEKA